ncbi:MAG: MarR family winged helix-turn-helix transcriptional regulator [Gemmatimonadaceae bacterium]
MVSRTGAGRADLLQAIARGGGELATVTVMFHTAIADRLGLTPSDYRVFEFALQYGPVTAGQLAEATALTTGAITGVIDRLEALGYVKRVKDPADRRKVFVHATMSSKARQRLTKLFAPMVEGVSALAASYSDQELAAIVDYFRRVIELMHAETVRIRAATGP